MRNVCGHRLTCAPSLGRYLLADSATKPSLHGIFHTEWTMFSPTYFRVAFQAWGRELGAT